MLHARMRLKIILWAFPISDLKLLFIIIFLNLQHIPSLWGLNIILTHNMTQPPPPHDVLCGSHFWLSLLLKHPEHVVCHV
jgi:hypothetical protein